MTLQKKWKNWKRKMTNYILKKKNTKISIKVLSKIWRPNNNNSRNKTTSNRKNQEEGYSDAVNNESIYIK